MIKAENIRSNADVKIILDRLKPVNKYIESLKEGSSEDEEMSFAVHMQFCEILSFLFNGDLHEINDNNCYIADLVIFKMWDYLRGKCNFKNLIKELNKLNNEYIK